MDPGSVTRFEQELPSLFREPAKALASWQELGFHVEVGVWSAAERKHLLERARAHPSWTGGTKAPVMMIHRADPAFVEALKKPAVLEVIERFVAGRVAALQSQLFFVPPGTPGFSAHQDASYVQAPRDAFASAWNALEDVDRENGSLIVWPGTHREEILAIEPNPDAARSVSQDPNASAMRCRIPEKYRPVDLTLPAGSVVFIHGHLVHGSHPNWSRDRHRHVLLNTYIRKGESFRPGDHAKRRELDVYRDLEAVTLGTGIRRGEFP